MKHGETTTKIFLQKKSFQKTKTKITHVYDWVTKTAPKNRLLITDLELNKPRKPYAFGKPLLCQLKTTTFFSSQKNSTDEF